MPANSVSKAVVPTSLALLIVIVTALGAFAEPTRALTRCNEIGQIVTGPDGWEEIRGPRPSRGPEMVAAYAVRPDKPQVMLVTNGEVIARSNDGGCSFTETFHVSDLPPEADSGAVVEQIVFAPAGGRVYATVTGPQKIAVPQVIASSDGGTSWVPVANGLSPAGRPVKLVVAPSAAQKLYLVIDTPLSSASEVYLSRDAGASWEHVSGPIEDSEGTLRLQVIDVAVHPADPTILWAAPRRDVLDASAGLYRSDDGGATWNPVPDVGQGFADTGIELETVSAYRAPTGRVTVLAFAGASNLGGTNIFYRSVDGGRSWASGNMPAAVTSAAQSAGGAMISTVVADDFGAKVFRTEVDDASWSWYPAASAGRPSFEDISSDDQGIFYARTNGSLMRTLEVTPSQIIPGGLTDGAKHVAEGANPCALWSPPQPEWKEGWDPVPVGAGPVYVAKFGHGELLAYNRTGRGELVARIPTFAEGIALDPLGRLIIATRFSDTLTRYVPETCAVETIDPKLNNAEGPEFDPDGNLFVVSTGGPAAEGDLPATVWRYPWPQYPGQPREFVWQGGGFIEDVRVAPPASPFAGDLFVLVKGPGRSEGQTGIIRLRQTEDGSWDASHFVYSFRDLGPSFDNFGALGMKFHPDGRLLIPEWEPYGGRIVELSANGRSFRIFARVHEPRLKYLNKIDIAWNGDVYVTGSTSNGSGDGESWVLRFDATGRRLLPDFRQGMDNFGNALGIAVPNFRPPGTVPGLPPPSDEPDLLGGPDPDPPKGIIFGPGQVPPPPGPPVVAAPAVGYVPLGAQAPAQAPAQSQAAIHQAVVVAQRQEQPQMAFVQAAQQLKQQTGLQHAMARSFAHRSDPMDAVKFGLAMSGVVMMLVYGLASATVRRVVRVGRR